MLADSEDNKLGGEGSGNDLPGGISAKTDGTHDTIAAMADFEATQVWHTTARHNPEVSARVARLP